MKETEKRMNLRNNYFILENAVTDRFCDHVIEYGKYLKEQVATTWGYDTNNLSDYDKKKLEKTRKSKVTWMSDNWMYREIQPIIHQVNAQAGWNFQWSMTESFQFTKYEGTQKQHYDWHTDSGDADENGLIRKISASLILANDDEYEGGDFQICIPNPKENKTINIKLKQKGTMIFFPSFVWHRVVPVTKGTRYSLVCWSAGNLFK
jgi:PKHD-type hydroxylase|tara:strand:+ start:104 stop:721 length:618 start_codon:yes stop_codon:yes gene_type:complete